MEEDFSKRSSNQSQKLYAKFDFITWNQKCQADRDRKTKNPEKTFQ
jgi:hypothetical protein